MYCHQCGKENSIKAKFCRHCGSKLQDSKQNEFKSPQAQNSKIDDQDPYFISTNRLILSGLLGGALYQMYWFYRQWKSITVIENLKINKTGNFFRGVFSVLTSFSLFKHIASLTADIDNADMHPRLLASMYFILNGLWRFPQIYTFLGLLAIIPLVFVQQRMNRYWNIKSNNQISLADYSGWEITLIVIGGLIHILVIVGLFSTANNSY